MKEYIERQKAKEAIAAYCAPIKNSLQASALNELLVQLDILPAADVVEVVRCKECVSSRPINKEYWVENAFYEECVWCRWFDTGMLPDEYCSYGKRKMEKEE